MKLLDGTELADYVKERQAKQVRNLRQSWATAPKLAIIQTVDDPVIDTYVRMKRRYGQDVLVDVDVHRPSPDQIFDTIASLNDDGSCSRSARKTTFSQFGIGKMLLTIPTQALRTYAS